MKRITLDDVRLYRRKLWQLIVSGIVNERQVSFSSIIQKLQREFGLTKEEAKTLLVGDEDKRNRIIKEHNRKVEEAENENEEDNGLEI
jgi:hypothetical protein